MNCDRTLICAPGDECLTPVEYDTRYPRPPGGLCHAMGMCPLMTHE